MAVCDLVKHKDYDKYGIVLDILVPDQGKGTYFVILWAGRLNGDWVWDDMVERA